MRILDAGQTRALLTPELAFEAVRSAFLDLGAGRITPFPRRQLAAGGDRALLGLMPVTGIGDTPWGLKVVLVGRDNRARGLDSHQGFMVLADPWTGRPRALIDAATLTERRTAAASAVATDALANAEPARIAILGGGTQARSHVEALRRLYPDAEFVVWTRSDARDCARNLDAVPAADPADAVREADIVCTVTGASTPILSLADIAPGTHVNAVGASRPTAREIAGDLVAAAQLFIDSRDQAEIECGEILLARDEGLLSLDHPIVALQDVLSDAQPGRGSPDAVTLYKSLGIAAQDLGAAVAVVARAEAEGMGTIVDL